MPKIAIDFETYYDNDYSIKGTSPWAYTRDLRFDPYLISVSDGADVWAGEPKNFNWDALKGATLFSHNAAFDSTVYEAMVELGLAPQISYADWHCTANMTSFLCNRRSLGDSVERLYGIHLDKGMRSWMKNKHWPDAISGGKAEELLKYARIDALQCWKLAEDFFGKWPAKEVALSKMTIDQGKHGIAINVEKLGADINFLKVALFETERILPWWTSERDFKPTSTKRIAEQCREAGIPCPPVKSHEGGEEEFIAWEAEFGPKYLWVAAVSRWRSLNKVLGTLEAIKDRLRPDGTITFSLKYFGGHTGRWSGDAGLNLQNLRKSPLAFTESYELIEDAPRLSAIERGEFEPFYTIDIRSLFVPRAGKKFGICDLSQIEPRVLAWMTGDFAFLDLVRNGMAIYEAYARLVLGWCGGNLKKENPTLYKLAKAHKLALSYSCGPEKFVTAAKTLADFDVTLEEAERIVPEFRAQNPKLVSLWKTMDVQMRNSVGQDFTVDLPAGRTMRYEKIRREARLVRDKKTGEQRMSNVVTADIGGMRKKLYGGLLVENTTQAIARDVFAEHLLLAQSAGHRCLFSVHDEAIFEVDPSLPKEEIERIMSTTPDWLSGCPIAAEAIDAQHYKK